jgi:hypothetical protein
VTTGLKRVNAIRPKQGCPSNPKMQDASLSVQWFNRISSGKPVAYGKMNVRMHVFVRLVEPAVA